MNKVPELRKVDEPHFEALREFLREGMTSIVMPHLNPDGDAIGSCIALADFLQSYGHKVMIVCNDEIPRNLSFLLTHPIHRAEDVIEMSLEPIDVAFVVDCGDVGRIEDRSHLLPLCKKTVVIDHHATHVHFGDISLVDIAASSTGELIHRIFSHFGTPIGESSRDALYVAISTDTGSFKYNNTTPYALRAVADFVEQGFETTRCVVEVYQNKPFIQYAVQREVLKNLILSEGGSSAFSHLDFTVFKDMGFSNQDTDGIAEWLRDIEGVQVSCFARPIDEERYKLSLRSKGDIDVSAIAQVFDGGGHKRASGCSVSGSYATIRESIFDLIDNAHRNSVSHDSESNGDESKSLEARR